MTSMDRRSPRVTCYKARDDSRHPKPFGIALSKLLPALRAESARLRVPIAGVEMAADDADKRATLDAQREGVGDAYAAGAYGRVGSTDAKSRLADRLSALDDALDALDAAKVVVTVPDAVDWTKPPAVVNAVLRAMWERVELGPDLMPARFVWRVPEWRA
jgi:hypothetical protein